MMKCHRRIERVADYIGEIVIGKTPGLGEPVGMHEDHQAQLFTSGEGLAEAVGRQILAGHVGHDLDAAKTQGFVQSLELGDREIGSLEGHSPEPDETVRVAAANLGNEIVDGARGLAPEIGIGPVVGLTRRR